MLVGRVVGEGGIGTELFESVGALRTGAVGIHQAADAERLAHLRDSYDIGHANPEFVAFALDRLLSKHEAAGGGESGNQMRLRLAFGAIMAAPRSFAVDGRSLGDPARFRGPRR